MTIVHASKVGTLRPSVTLLFESTEDGMLYILDSFIHLAPNKRQAVDDERLDVVRKELHITVFQKDRHKCFSLFEK